MPGMGQDTVRIQIWAQEKEMWIPEGTARHPKALTGTRPFWRWKLILKTRIRNSVQYYCPLNYLDKRDFGAGPTFLWSFHHLF